MQGYLFYNNLFEIIHLFNTCLTPISNNKTPFLIIINNTNSNLNSNNNLESQMKKHLNSKNWIQN